MSLKLTTSCPTCFIGHLFATSLFSACSYLLLVASSLCPSDFSVQPRLPPQPVSVNVPITSNLVCPYIKCKGLQYLSVTDEHLMKVCVIFYFPWNQWTKQINIKDWDMSWELISVGICQVHVCFLLLCQWFFFSSWHWKSIPHPRSPVLLKEKLWLSQRWAQKTFNLEWILTFFFLQKQQGKNEGSLPTIKPKACVFNGDRWTVCLVGPALFIRDTYMFCLMVQLSVHQWQKKVMSAWSAANRKFCVLFCSAKEIEFGSWTNRHKSMIWKSQMAFLSYAEGCKGL